MNRKQKQKEEEDLARMREIANNPKRDFTFDEISDFLGSVRDIDGNDGCLLGIAGSMQDTTKIHVCVNGDRYKVAMILATAIISDEQLGEAVSTAMKLLTNPEFREVVDGAKKR